MTELPCFIVMMYDLNNTKILISITSQENLKSKDQAIRKYEQELDSLTFRNQQLASRVSFLQQELDQSHAKSKKNKVVYLFN